MILCFKLSMPNVGSWNGKWTSQDKLHVKLVSFQGKKRIERAKEILEKSRFTYNFGDGWRAAIDVYHIDGSFPKSEPARLRRESAGFCGYDWMVDSIISDLDIIAPSDKEEKCTDDCPFKTFKNA